MALKSWSIPSFTGATAEVPVSQTLLEATGTTIITLSLLISNFSDANPAHIVVTRQGSDNSVKFKWILDIPATNSPFALDSKMVFVNGDKLVISADNPDVSVDASGDES